MTLDVPSSIGRVVHAVDVPRRVARRPLPPGCRTENDVRAEAVARGLAKVRAAAYQAGLEDGRAGRRDVPRPREIPRAFLADFLRGQAEGLGRSAAARPVEESSRVA